MAPITRAQARAVPPPASPPLRRLVGLLVLLAAAPIMAVWLLLHAIAATAVLGTSAILQAFDYAGTVALGR